MAEVLIKDRDKEVEQLRLALVLSGVNASYTTVDLIHRVQMVLKRKKDQFSIKDAAEIEVVHGKYWDDYFSKQQNKSSKPKRTKS